MATDKQSRQQSSERAQTGSPSAQQGEWQPSTQRSGGQMTGGTGQSTQPTQRATPPSRRSGMFEPGYFGGGPFSMMRRFNEEMDRLFDSFGMGRPYVPSLFGRWGAGTDVGGRGGQEGLTALWSPSVDVCESEGKFCVTADLPGLRKEDVNVQVDNDQIVIQGQRNDERTTNEEGYYQRERSYGSFYRTIPLPEGARADQATATFDNGVLRIEMPSTQQAPRGRKLEIRDASGSTATSRSGQGVRSESSSSGTSGTEGGSPS